MVLEFFGLFFCGLSCPNLHVQTEKTANRVNFDLPNVSKMMINFEQFKVSKMASLKIYMSPITEKLETSNLTVGKGKH